VLPRRRSQCSLHDSCTYKRDTSTFPGHLLEHKQPKGQARRGRCRSRPGRSTSRSTRLHVSNMLRTGVGEAGDEGRWDVASADDGMESSRDVGIALGTQSETSMNRIGPWRRLASRPLSESIVGHPACSDSSSEFLRMPPYPTTLILTIPDPSIASRRSARTHWGRATGRRA